MLCLLLILKNISSPRIKSFGVFVYIGVTLGASWVNVKRLKKWHENINNAKKNISNSSNQ